MKPVAWGYRYSDGNIYDVICPEEHDRLEGMYTVPLYTAPRELSDEDVVIPRELAENYLKITEIPRYKRILEDALKKASEK